MLGTFSGLMLDAARCLERPNFYRDAIDFAAERGFTKLLWHFTDDQGCAMQFRSIPDIASPNAFSRAEMRSLVGYAAERGIDVIPELASLGHTAYLTRLPRYAHLAESAQMFSSICPVAPETRPLIASLLQEVCDVFNSPVVHVGMDESNFGHHPMTIDALRTRSRTSIVADHLGFLHDLLTRRGRQMWMWADGLLHDPVLAGQLPRDIVQCNWRYHPNEPVETTQSLLDYGYDVVICSASISSQQMLFPGEQFALPNVRSLHKHESLTAKLGKARVIGRINTVWTPVRYLAGSLWLGLDLVFAIMRDGPDVDLQARIKSFGSDFYGVSDLSDFYEACEIVLLRSPTRDEWLAAITMQTTSDSLAGAIKNAQPQWARAYQGLQTMRQQVCRHEESFDAFLLMVRLAATAYTFASRIDIMSEEEAGSAADEWQNMIHQIERQWDRERFADDPRKYAAPIDHYAGDHLIPMMMKGQEKLTAMSGLIGAK